MNGVENSLSLGGVAKNFLCVIRCHCSEFVEFSTFFSRRDMRWSRKGAAAVRRNKSENEWTRSNINCIVSDYQDSLFSTIFLRCSAAVCCDSRKISFLCAPHWAAFFLYVDSFLSSWTIKIPLFQVFKSDWSFSLSFTVKMLKSTLKFSCHVCLHSRRCWFSPPLTLSSFPTKFSFFDQTRIRRERREDFHTTQTSQQWRKIAEEINYLAFFLLPSFFHHHRT